MAPSYTIQGRKGSVIVTWGVKTAGYAKCEGWIVSKIDARSLHDPCFVNLTAALDYARDMSREGE
jgi:hypothetical protein